MRNALGQGAPYAVPIGAVALADVLIERGQLAAAEAILAEGGSAPPGLVTSFALEVMRACGWRSAGPTTRSRSCSRPGSSRPRSASRA